MNLPSTVMFNYPTLEGLTGLGATAVDVAQGVGGNSSKPQALRLLQAIHPPSLWVSYVYRGYSIPMATDPYFCWLNQHVHWFGP